MKKKSPLAVIFFVVFIDLVGFGIVIPILPYYAKTFGASAAVLGCLMASYSAMQLLFAPLWGALSDRIGRRPVILASLAGAAIAFTVMGFAHSIAWLFAGRLFAGIAGANISAATAYIADITTPEHRAKGMGVIGASFGLGFIFGPAIGGVLSQWGFGVPMFAAAALSILNLFFAWLNLPEPVIAPGARAANRTSRFDLAVFRKTVVREPRVSLAIVLFFTATLAFTQIEVSFALYMLEKFGYTARDSGYVLAVMGLIGAFIQGALIGRLSKRYSETFLILAGTSFLSLGTIAFSHSPTIAAVLSSVVIVAIGNAVYSPMVTALASKGAPATERGAVMGIYHSFGSAARILGPLTGGYLFDHSGPAAPFTLAALLYALCFGITTHRAVRIKSLA